LLRRLKSEGVAAKDVAVITADGQDDSHFAAGCLHAGHRVIKVPASHEEEVLTEHTDVIRAFNLIEAKGREFPIVILCDIPMMENDFDRNFMLVAVTRAKAKLYILCGEERKKALSDIINSKQ
jgi:superfamily I DNA and RNA helicase